MLILWACTGVANARVSTQHTRHFIRVAVAGAEANEWMPGGNFSCRPGGGGNLDLGYEMQGRHWIWGVGARGMYQYTETEAKPYADIYDGYTHPIHTALVGQYRYCYTNYRESYQTAAVALPIYAGIEYKPVYALFGVELRYLLYQPAKVKTDIKTDLIMPGYIIETDPTNAQSFVDMGAYPVASYEGTAKRVEPLQVAVSAEVGGYLPMRRKWHGRLRLGAYCSMGIRMAGAKQQTDRYHEYQAPYIIVPKEEQTTFPYREWLSENIQWQSMVNTTRYTVHPINVEVGIRLTALIELKKPDVCVCLK